MTRSSSEQPNAPERRAPIRLTRSRGIVDRPQQEDQVADLLALEVVAAALVAVGDAGSRRAPPRRPRGRCARAAGSRRRASTARRMLAGDAVADRPGLRRPRRRRGAPRRPPRPPRCAHALRRRPPGRGRAATTTGGRSRPLLERRLASSGTFAGCRPSALLEEPVEGVVDPLDHARDRAEVLDDLAQAVGERAALDLVVDADVGAAEAVDRLLRIADDEQLAVGGHELAPVLDAPGRRSAR